MKSNILSRFLTNNHRFKPNDPEYRKVYLVNVFLLVMLSLCFIYFIFNLLGDINNYVIIMNVTGFVLSLLGLIYFHKTDQIDKTNVYSVVILLSLVFAYFIISDNLEYSLYWLVIIPPFIFFLLGYKKAKVVSFVYFGLVVLFIISSYNSWESIGFGYRSLINIVGPTLVLIFIISFYEKSRYQASEELGIKNLQLAEIISELSENHNRIQSLLSSTGEGIYGINVKGECVFCNKSGLDFLGYMYEAELLGKDMHAQIHSKYRNGTPMNINDCKIFNVFKSGKGIRVSDEVFWKKDGTCFDVEYASFPQYSKGELVGAVISFRDIAEEKINLKKEQYLNSHDWLTDLYSRNWFETLLTEMDNEENLPLSIIFADINGLKLTNDIFGHAAGDQLLIKGSEVLKFHQRKQDLLARVGGDEFTLVFPKTTFKEATKIQEKIQAQFATQSVRSLPCSMSVGCATKIDKSMQISQTIIDAEGEMYKEKTKGRQNVSADILYTLIELLHSKSPREKVHSENVVKYAGMLGDALRLSPTDLAQLKKMAFFHDIGKIILEDEILLSEGAFSKSQLSKMRQHPAIAYRILNLFDETLDIAAGIYAHHENWDGSGYPRGLKGEEIPYMARIISVAEIYDALTNKIGGNNWTKEMALEEISAVTGIKIDPYLAPIFIGLMRKDESGSFHELENSEEEDVI